MAIVPMDLFFGYNAKSTVVRLYSLNVTFFHVIFIGLAFIYGFSIFHEWNLLGKKFRYIMICMAIICIFLTIFVAYDKFNSFIALIQFALLAIFYLSMKFLIRVMNDDFSERVWLVLGLGVIIYLAIWAVTVAIRWPTPNEWTMDAVPGLSNVRYVGFLSLAALCGGVSILTTGGKAGRVPAAFVVLTIGAWGSALWTGTRGAVVSLFVASLVATLLATGDRKRTAAVLLGSLVLAAPLALLLPGGNDIYGVQSLFRGAQASGVNEYSSGRLDVWRDVFERAMMRPLFGWGLDQSMYNAPGLPPGVKHPHNWPLQIFLSTGIAGLVLVPTMLISMISWKKSVLWNRSNIPAIAGISGLLVYSLYDGAAYYLYPLTIGAIALASLREPSPPAPDRSD